VNKAFTAEPKNPAHAAGLAIRSIVRILTTYDLKPTMAGALLDQTFKGHAEAFSAVQSGASSPAASPGFAREGQELMAQLLRFTAKTPQGKQAAASLTAFSENQTNRLVGALRGSLPQGANTAFELLVKNKKFTRLEPQTRFALLSQINNYRDNNRITEVIENLGRLARQPWFVGSLLAHQQLSAQIVAFDSQYDGSKNIRYKLEPILQGDGKKFFATRSTSFSMSAATRS